MHPILESRGKLALYLAAWAPAAALLAVLLTSSGRFRWPAAVSLAAPMAVFYSFFSLAAWYLCRAFPLGRTSVLQLVAVHLMAALVSGALWLWLGKGIAYVLSGLPTFGDITAAYSAQRQIVLGVGILLFLLAAAAHYVMAAFQNSLEAERRALELQVLAREAELKALKAQIDPHFLFNSLNSISALTTVDPAACRKVCLLLADFLRNSLSLGSRRLIRLDEELSLALEYLEIEQVRLGPRLKVESRIDERSRACLVPPLLLQPLVENAIRHGIAQRVSEGAVEIRTETWSDRVRIMIENPCDADKREPARKGMGLRIVRERLRTLYGDEARMETERNENLFRAVLSLPAVPPGEAVEPDTVAPPVPSPEKG